MINGIQKAAVAGSATARVGPRSEVAGYHGGRVIKRFASSPGRRMAILWRDRDE